MSGNKRNEVLDSIPSGVIDIAITSAQDDKQTYIAILANGKNIKFSSKNDKTAKYRAYRISVERETKLAGLKRVKN